jgi:hypothetical protein
MILESFSIVGLSLNLITKARCITSRLDPDILTQTLYITVMILGQVFMVSLPCIFIKGYTFVKIKSVEDSSKDLLFSTICGLYFLINLFTLLGLIHSIEREEKEYFESLDKSAIENQAFEFKPKKIWYLHYLLWFPANWTMEECLEYKNYR